MKVMFVCHPTNITAAVQIATTMNERRKLQKFPPARTACPALSLGMSTSFVSALFPLYCVGFSSFFSSGLAAAAALALRSFSS